MSAPRPFDDLEAEIERIAENPSGTEPLLAVTLLVQSGEDVLAHWVAARGGIPTDATREGFRLLALHRQGAKGEPSFNACRETCRELAYHYNLVTTEPEHADTGRRVLMTALVARHLLYFVSGKLEVAGLGEFCCAAKPMRSNDVSSTEVNSEL